MHLSHGQKVGLVTFGVFMAEAILHYNYGKNEHLPKGDKKFMLPPKKEFFKITITVAAFSTLNGIIVHRLLKGV